MVKELGVLRAFYCLVLLLCLQLTVSTVSGSLNFEGSGTSSVGTAARVVKNEERTLVVATEFGSISAVDIDDGTGRHDYHLQFITMEPNSLFLPVLLHRDMVFYVQTGSGRLSWTEGDETNQVSLQRGDVYRLKSGIVFYLHSSLEPERPRFRILAMFANPDEEQSQSPSFGPYSSINDLVRGFDTSVLQAAFQVSEEVIEEITTTTDTPAIVHSDQESRKRFWEEEILFINALFGIQRSSKQGSDNKKKHTKTFNFFKENPDFKSCNGWSKVVTKHDLKALHGSQIGVFMVNLTKGSIMGPHWNPAATEVSVVLEGEGMVQVVCPSALTNKECQNTRIRVEEGDVFTVPRFHPMAQTSFNNGSLVFMGFSTTSKKNHPQFLAGKASVLQTLDKLILGTSFDVSNTTIGQLLAAQEESIILGCTSCAEEQEMVMEEQIERERQEEEERKREEEEKRKREEEAKRREEKEKEREREEEEKRKHEEEERKRREEEEKEREREQEEQRRREEEEQAKRREEKEKEREREEEEKRKHEEEERKRREEEEKEREREQEEQRRREEEEQRRMDEEEERRREEEEEKRRREEEEQRQREDEEQRRRQKEEEQKRREEEEERKRQEEEERQKEEEEQRRQEEEEQRRQEEEQRQKEEEEQRRREKEEQRRQEEEELQQEEQRQQEKEREEERRREEQAEEKRRQEGDKRRQEEEQRRQEEERGRSEEEKEEEMARRQEEERVEREREAEEVGGRWRTIKLKINKQARGKQVYNGLGY